MIPPNADFRLEGFNLFLIILSKYPFEGMAIGALGAYLLFHGKDGILKLIFHPFTKWLTLLLLVLNIAFFRLTPMSIYFHNFSQIVYSCLYMSFILNVVHDKTFLPHFDAPIYDFLGKLSYGIYMYHMLTIYFTLIAFDMLGWGDNSFLYNSVLYAVVTGLTILAAYVSYRWLEQPFLNMKKKFQTIESVTTQGEAEKEQKPA
jgi:peptidoglycan/LPS O-acetylase OafA/YrhL